MLFANYSYPSLSHLWNTHRNLAHPSVEGQMPVIESTRLLALRLDTRKQVSDIAEKILVLYLRLGGRQVQSYLKSRCCHAEGR